MPFHCVPAKQASMFAVLGALVQCDILCVYMRGCVCVCVCVSVQAAVDDRGNLIDQVDTRLDSNKAATQGLVKQSKEQYKRWV